MTQPTNGVKPGSFSRFDRSGNGAMVGPSGYLEVVAVRRQGANQE